MRKIVINEDFTDSGEEKVELQEEQSTEVTTEETKEVVETEGSETTETSEETEETEVAEEPKKIKIGDKEFTEEELAGIVEKGGKVKEWETKMPGFNLDTLMPDYTRKSQKLAQYERPQKKEVEQVDLSDINQEELTKIEKVVKSLGYVKQDDLIKNSVETQKDVFIASHPEYKPGNEVNDAKWNQLMETFSLYNWQAHPDKVEELLERAHAEVSKTWNEAAKNQKTQEAVTTKKAVASAVATGGSGSAKSQPKSDNSALADKYRALGWAEEDIKEILT